MGSAVDSEPLMRAGGGAHPPPESGERVNGGAHPSPEPAERAVGSVHPRITLWQRLAGVDPSIPDDWTRPSPGLRGLRFDVPIAVLIVGMMALTERFYDLIGLGDEAPIYASEPWTVVVIPACFFVAIALRRILPIPAMVLAVVAFLVGQGAPYGEHLFTQIACFVCIFSAAAWSPRRHLVTVLNLVVLAIFLAAGVSGGLYAAQTAGYTGAAVVTTFVFNVAVNILFVLAATLFGSNEYRRSGNAAALAHRTEQLRERTAALEAEQRIVAEQAVRLDRVEIARELHDVVAHHVSLMGLQAAAARRSLAASPEKAERSLLAVEESARSAIAELQLLLTTLRSPGEVSARADASAVAAVEAGGQVEPPSTISIDRIPDLVESVRSAGMPVSFQVVGNERPVTNLVGFTAYRILQEALTNVQKHAGERVEVDVRLRYLADALELDVTNSRPNPARPRSRLSGGRGIAGMRERAHAIGGTLEAGPRPSGGFRVLARLPIEAAAAPARYDDSRRAGAPPPARGGT